MSVTKKMLKGMGLTEEQQETILEAHSETVKSLEAQRDGYKADAEKLSEVQKRLDAANAALESAKKNGWESKYNEVKKQFDAYKSDVESKATAAAKAKAYRALIEKAGIKGDKLIDTILHGADLSKVTLDGGAVKGADDIVETLKNEWKDFIPVEREKGQDVETPPNNNGGDAGRSRASEIAAEYHRNLYGSVKEEK